LGSLFVFSPAHADSEKLISPITKHSYQRFDTSKTWSEAKNTCTAQGGYLATITSEVELAMLKIKKILSGSMFLGATDMETYGSGTIDTMGANWTWITGEPFVYSPWYSSASKSGAIGQDYLYLTSSGSFKSTKATATNRYLCEWDPENTITSSTSADSLSWNIPKQQGCSENRLKKSSDTLTSAACFNTGDTVATVEVTPVGTSNSTVMKIKVKPLADNSGTKMGYFFKITFPSELKISPITIANKSPLTKETEMPEVMMDFFTDMLSKTPDLISKGFGNYATYGMYLWKYSLKPETAGDPSFLTKVPSDSVLSKRLYPYQTFEQYFELADENTPITITLSSAVPFATFKDILDAKGMSFYLGSDVMREILVEKMVSAK
jgi:hypothetical protein